MPPIQIALVRHHDRVPEDEFFTVAAALQTQATRDVAPIWGVQAVISPFLKLEQVPPGYFPILLVEAVKGGHDYHALKKGLPMAVVQYLKGTAWSVLASHEMVEMIVDPGGNLTTPTWTPDDGWRQNIVEVCDPCQDVFYLIGDVAVSDFVTPDYYDPSTTRDVRYSFTGALRAPLTLTAEGCRSYVMEDGSVRQAVGTPTKRDRPVRVKAGVPLRASTGQQTNEISLVLAKIAAAGTAQARQSGLEYAAFLETQVNALLAGGSSGPSVHRPAPLPASKLPTQQERIVALVEQLGNPAYTTYRDFQANPKAVYALFGITPPAKETLQKIIDQFPPQSHFAQVVRTSRTGRLFGQPDFMDYIKTHSSFHGWP